MPNPPFPSESNRLAAIADAARRLPAPEPASLDAVRREKLRAADLFLNFVQCADCGLPWPQGYEHYGCRGERGR